MSLTGREIVYVQGDYGTFQYPCGQQEITTTAQIAALGGGGGITPGPTTIVSGGTTYTTSPLADIFISWRSTDTANKTTIITTAGLVSGQVITIKDQAYTCNTYPITLIADSGGVTIDGEATFLMNTDGMAVNLKWDGASVLEVF